MLVNIYFPKTEDPGSGTKNFMHSLSTASPYIAGEIILKNKKTKNAMPVDQQWEPEQEPPSSKLKCVCFEEVRSFFMKKKWVESSWVEFTRKNRVKNPSLQAIVESRETYVSTIQKELSNR